VGGGQRHNGAEKEWESGIRKKKNKRRRRKNGEMKGG